MRVLRDNKLVFLDMHEDNRDEIRAIKFKEGTMVRDKIYTLKYESDRASGRSGYIFRVTQSPWNDNSGLNAGIDGQHLTVGDAVNGALHFGYRVFNGDVEIKL